MTILESIYDYLKNHCDLIKENHQSVGFNFISDVVESCSVVEIPSDPVIKRYVDGGALKQCVFHFCSREFYGIDSENNLENDRLYEDLEYWFKEQSEAGNLPNLDRKRRSQYIETTTKGYLLENEGDEAKYVIQCRLVYSEE